MQFVRKHFSEYSKISLPFLQNIFKTFGNVDNYPFTIEKNIIKEILRICSIELNFPSKFKFKGKKQLITYQEVISCLIDIFGS